jgi:hypothetical protein
MRKFYALSLFLLLTTVAIAQSPVSPTAGQENRLKETQNVPVKDEQVVVSQPQKRESTIAAGFVWKNGALYIEPTIGGISIPVSGGGASGCFSDVQPAPSRAKLLRTITITLGMRRF